MSKLKNQAMEILHDIPDEKIIIVIEMLKAFRALYTQNIESKFEKDTMPDNVMGICGKYANPDLVSMEKEAWTKAVMEKHAAY